MTELFQTSRTNVVEHIKHIYEEGELDEISTCRNFRQVRKRRKWRRKLLERVNLIKVPHTAKILNGGCDGNK